MPDQQDAAPWLASLQQVQGRLTDVVATLAPEQIAGPSYDSEWSTAQVLSHLGSGAQIMTLFLDAGLNDSEPPPGETFQEIWQAWNAKPAPDQARDGIAASRELIDRVLAIDAAAAVAWELDMFGGLRRFPDLLRFRLAELAIHAWDVEVVHDPQAMIDGSAVGLTVDHLDQIVAWTGRPPAEPFRVHVITNEPTRHFDLHSDGSAVSIAATESGEASDGDALLRLPAEALIRLVYGRLDLAHTPPLVAERIDLGVLRATFPGV